VAFQCDQAGRYVRSGRRYRYHRPSGRGEVEIRARSIGEVLPGYEVALWNGIVAPAGTSAEIINKLNGAIVKSLNAYQEWQGESDGDVGQSNQDREHQARELAGKEFVLVRP
jgi:hypothetical protein